MEPDTTETQSRVSDRARKTAQAAFEAAELAKQTGLAAIESGRAYAMNAVNSAGQKLSDAKVQLNRATELGAQYVALQPVRGVIVAAACGAILGALLLMAVRRRH